MCIYTIFQYLCLCQKIKIALACNKVALDDDGSLVCPDDLYPMILDGIQRIYGEHTYGVGICSSIHCARNHSILPRGYFGEGKLFNGSLSFEDDTPIDDTCEDRDDRVDAWYRMLATDQQLEHIGKEYPTPLHERSLAGHFLLNFPVGPVLEPMDSIQWHELNPLYLSPAMLQWCVYSRFLPASLVGGVKSGALSPCKPLIGPFKIDRHHVCRKKRGVCKVCGENKGDVALM